MVVDGGGIGIGGGGQSFTVVYNGPTPPLIADVSVEKTSMPESVGPGDELTCVITVTNNGPDSAPAVVVEDVLPAGLTFQSTTTTQGSCVATPSKVTCDMGALIAGRKPK
ncbi:MAG: DUF11 domain-containing protein [Chloroflexi bacterium]|nr:DUF11 domain-containing protein [Chloroflexota bacterium]